MSEDRTGQEPDPADELDQLLDEIDVGEPEPEPEPQPEPEPEPEPQAPRTQTRGDRRFATLTRRYRELEAENVRLRAQPQPQQQQPYQPPPDPMAQARAEQEELERVNNMPFEQQSRYWATKYRDEARRENMLQNLRTQDAVDRMMFQGILRDEGYSPNVAQEVENLLIQARQQNMNPSREWLLNAYLGQEGRKHKKTAAARAKVAGQRRIASQTTQPANTGSTAASGNRGRTQNQDAEDEALLRGITVGDFLKGA